MFLEWLEHHLIPCPTKHFFGIDCPGCGMQRSIIELLRGNLWESIKLYPPLIPLLVLLIFLAINLRYDSPVLQKILKYIFITDAAIILVNYIFKFI